MKLRVIFLCTVLLFLLSGCDRIRATLGMATSEDIEIAKSKLEEKVAMEKRMRDSIDNAMSENLSDSSSITPSSTLDKTGNDKDKTAYSGALSKRFYIIIGSFKKDYNTRSMLDFLKKQGYEPIKIPLKNGYDMVSLCGYDSYQQAREEVLKIENWEVCPYDVWIYDVKQGLHE